jgi:TRAP-type C4-dicarboxylate transport system permease small subunit
MPDSSSNSMTALFTFATRSVRILALIGSIGTVAMMLHICLDVVLRDFLRISLVTTPEVVARYYMVVVAFLPLAWLEMRNGMISVELLEWALGARARQVSDILVALFSALVYGVLAWTTAKTALQQFSIGTYVEFTDYKMPVWHSYFLPPLGFVLAALVCLLKAIESAVQPDTSHHPEPLA